ncbi:MAG: hypothetical protein H2056_08560 [Sphingopyxis sp.]|nr:hypothetical protein [Sphingopyxis sp.]
MSDDEAERAKRRRLAAEAEEEEAWHRYEEYQQQLAKEQKDAHRELAVDSMVGWFHEHFEDPQNQTPIDSEDGVYIYIWGGPFDASEVLGDEFSPEFSDELIGAAVERVQASGTFEWAPTSFGDYYDHPEEEDESSSGKADGVTSTLTKSILTRLSDLEQQLADLSLSPALLGHNGPPDDVGFPPYDEETKRELNEAADAVRQQVSNSDPSEAELRQAESTFRRFSKGISAWIGKKLDLIVDEAIKALVKASTWTLIATTALGLADDIAQFIRLLSPF